MKYSIGKERVLSYIVRQGEQGIAGKDGSQITSMDYVGETEDGGYIYRMTFDNGYSQDFIAPRGRDGLDGKDGKDGQQGERGLQGPKGERGEQGLQGIQGIQGERGFTGEKGDRGEKGENAVGYFQMYVDGSGNLILQHYEGDTVPEFKYDANTGYLYIVG